MSDNVGITLNRLAREQMKLRLLADIRIDLEVCELEGTDKLEYLNELSCLLNEIIGIAKTEIGGK